MFANAVFEAIEVKGGPMVKEGDFEAEKIQIIRKKNQISNLVFMSYGHFSC